MKIIKTILNSIFFSKIFMCLSVTIVTMSIVNKDASAYVIYTDQTSWENAVTETLTTDTFNYSIPAANTITFDSGVISTKSGSNYQAVNGSVFVGQVTGSTTLTWELPWDITALGFDVVSVNNNTSLIADFDGNGNESINLGVLSGSTYYNGFFGVIGDSAFSSAVFVNSGSVDTFTVDNLSFNKISIPEPETLYLFILGIIGMGFIGYKKHLTKAY